MSIKDHSLPSLQKEWSVCTLSYYLFTFLPEGFCFPRLQDYPEENYSLAVLIE